MRRNARTYAVASMRDWLGRRGGTAHDDELLAWFPLMRQLAPSLSPPRFTNSVPQPAFTT